jgi:hypothetical protein
MPERAVLHSRKASGSKGVDHAIVGLHQPSPLAESSKRSVGGASEAQYHLLPRLRLGSEIPPRRDDAVTSVIYRRDPLLLVIREQDPELRHRALMCRPPTVVRLGWFIVREQCRLMASKGASMPPVGKGAFSTTTHQCLQQTTLSRCAHLFAPRYPRERGSHLALPMGRDNVPTP